MYIAENACIYVPWMTSTVVQQQWTYQLLLCGVRCLDDLQYERQGHGTRAVADSPARQGTPADRCAAAAISGAMLGQSCACNVPKTCKAAKTPSHTHNPTPCHPVCFGLEAQTNRLEAQTNHELLWNHL